jgi:hypothetical protein
VETALPIAAGAALALAALAASFVFVRKRRLLADIPTSKADGVFIGFVEIRGEARCERPLTSYLSSTSCVHYAWSVDEHWSRTVTETYTDSDGKRKTRTRVESGWRTVAEGGEMTLFEVVDDTGAVRVDPRGAKIEAVELYDESCGPGDALYYGKGPSGAVPNSTHERRFHETGLPLGARLWVAGQAREREDVVAPEIAADKDAPYFLISTRSEEQIGRGWTAGAWSFGILAAVPAAGGAWIASVGRPEAVVGAALGTWALWTLGWVWTAYNSLVNLRQRVRQAGSRVDVELKRRADLIPNLVAAVKGARDHERETQEAVAELRAQAEATRPGEPGPDPRAVGPLVRTVAERYPELRAGENFDALRAELAKTEERLALARGYFNDIATFYNTRLERIPERFVGALASMKPSP